MTTFYPVAFHREADGRWAVLFPGLPGCQTCGDSFAEAQDMALDALEGHLLALDQDREPWPAPLTLEEARHDEDSEGAEVLALLPAPPRPGRAKRINITVPENWLDLIDAAAARAGLNRSGYLTQAALIQARRDRGLGARPDEETA